MVRPSDWWVLDLEGDPTPGSPAAVRRMARTWSTVADDAAWAERRVRQLMGDEALGKWIGEAGDAFRSKTGDLPGQLGKCADSYGQAADALSWWAGRLETHQSDADAALVKGRAAHADLEEAKQRASAAAASVTHASGVPVLTDHSLAPTPEQVKDAQARLHSAQAARSSADAAVNAAQSRLDAARKLALDAKHLRENDGRTTADRIHEAADAGIPERSRWEKFKDWAGEAWHVIVQIAKVVVAVLGVVALIIGGPLAWVVFAAALILLADSIMRYMKGECSLWEVGLAALGCIPGTKGLTTLAELRMAFEAGGMLGTGAHVLASGKTALVEMASAVRSMSGSIRTTLVELNTTIRTRGLLAPLDDGLARLDLLVGPDRSFSGAYTELRAMYHSLRGGEFTSEGNLVVRRWTPHEVPGPLGGFEAKDMAHTFRSSSYDQILVRKDTTTYRAVTNGSSLNGPFWANEAPQGPLQTQLDFALMPEWQTSHVGGVTVTNPQATHYVEATVPPGATIYGGPAGPQTGVSMPGTHLEGGGEQLFIPHMPPHWLSPGVAKVGP